jgi:hypothetical protein
MMATVQHVTSKAGRTKFQATSFLLNRVYTASNKGIVHNELEAMWKKSHEKIQDTVWHLLLGTDEGQE